MSLHISVIAIEGCCLSELPTIFELCDYQILGAPQAISRAEELGTAASQPEDRNRVRKVAYTSSGWTYILDYELTMMDKREVWIECSRKSGQRVLCWVCEGASGSYGFRLFENGQELRAILCVDGSVVEQAGEPIWEEKGIAWDQAFEDEILNVAERIGAPYGYMEDDVTYQVYELDESHMAGAPVVAPQTATPPSSTPAKQKPWWRFW